MGESLPQRKRLSHDIPHWLPRESIWFLTINCRPRGKPQLCFSDGSRSATAEKVLAAAAHYHENTPPRWFLHLLLLMPDHLHGLVSFPPESSMKTVVASWKGYLAKTCGISWQSGFFDHRIRNEESLEEKQHYIRMNPVRSGLCSDSENWPHVLAYHPQTGQRIL